MSEQDTSDQSLAGSFDDELARFAEELRDLRISCGTPSLRELGKRAPSARSLSPSALSEAFNGRRLPRMDFLIAMVRTLLTIKDGRPVHHDDARVEAWRVRWMHLERLRQHHVRSSGGAARPETTRLAPARTPSANEVEDGPDEGQRAKSGGGPDATDSDVLRAAQKEAESILTVASANAEEILAAAQAERDQAAAELARARSRIADELAAAREEARRQREAASAGAARVREQTTREDCAGEATASTNRPAAADTPTGSPEAAAKTPDATEFSDIYSDIFGQRGPRSRTRRGQDAMIRLEITLDEAALGTTKEIQLDTAVTCTTCNGEATAPGTSARTCGMCHGKGEVPEVARSFLGQALVNRRCQQCQGFGTVIPIPCPECEGDGRVRARRALTVKLPGGVDNGTRIQLVGEGEVGPGGGPAGDLYVELAARAPGEQGLFSRLRDAFNGR